MNEERNLITRVKISVNGISLEFEGDQSFVEAQLLKYESKVFDSLASPKPVHAKKSTKRRTKTGRSTKETDISAQAKTKGRRVGGNGAVATLTTLVEENYFEEARTIGDIVAHCEENLARKFKANEFSGKLGRLVREKTLARKKNADSQYEYQNA